MLQRDGLDRQRAVFVDDLLLVSINGMEVDLVVEIMTEQLHLLFQHGLQGCRGIDSKTGRTSQQAKRAEHAYQPKAMVTMQMGDEDGTDLRKTKTRTAQLHLRALSAIHQEQFSPDFYNLRRGIMMQSGQGTATTQDMNSERLQNVCITDYMKNSS